MDAVVLKKTAASAVGGDYRFVSAWFNQPGCGQAKSFVLVFVHNLRRYSVGISGG
jgi:hypothetical protein